MIVALDDTIAGNSDEEVTLPSFFSFFAAEHVRELAKVRGFLFYSHLLVNHHVPLIDWHTMLDKKQKLFGFSDIGIRSNCLQKCN